MAIVTTELDLKLPDAAATEILGGVLAYTFPGAADNHASLYLEGDLGAGKTTCVRSMLRSFGVSGLIRSPTYTLIETYPLANLTCVHIDLYRLKGSMEADELGLRDFFSAGFLVIVEWPERAGEALPAPDLAAALTYQGSGRRCLFSAHTTRGDTWARNLGSDTRLIPYLSNLA